MKKTTLIFLLSTVTALVVASFVFISSLPFNTLTGNYQAKKRVYTLSPQGFAFFTRNPREYRLTTYVPDQTTGEWHRVERSNASLHNWLGVSRQCRRENVEIHTVQSAAKGKYIELNSAEFSSVIDTLSIVDTVANPFADPLLKGEIVFRFERPIPWAWSKNLATINQPIKLKKVYVQ
ncbi:MAG: SdpA family antimicrobial peptide system protein [Bacteroidota bacterium]